jgi:hypothetical protein
MTNKVDRDLNLQTTDLPHQPVELADKQLEGVSAASNTLRHYRRDFLDRAAGY